jgi:hypothetical protein
MLFMDDDIDFFGIAIMMPQMESGHILQVSKGRKKTR